MANTYFSFKSFTVHQDKTAMKVCTDACLFGAWTVKHALKPETKQILDIGTGTGLLSLMLAQFTQSTIDAVEIDKNAAIQARENFDASPWKNQLFVHHQSMAEYLQEQNRKFDLIISNPPFFENQLKSSQHNRNLAMHSQEFSLNFLARAMVDLLSDDGIGAVLIPYQRTEEWRELAHREKLSLVHCCYVKQSESHPFFRSMFLLRKLKKEKKNNTTEIKEEICIKVGPDYSEVFKSILKPYYLAF
ncbi:tRNA1(Val) (adenine(37)-N6)-methyltransferase [Sediminibacterium sp. C3]|uniref:tRNA1(Val) (adenine(37)-N6)-methyltransferase n=1 Tax=Sediminibacterium sp. C3 TaxID=1267211 RepID=UPI00047CA035|nr:methyltransferase [Sediminibacterium sp. C3]